MKLSLFRAEGLDPMVQDRINMVMKAIYNSVGYRGRKLLESGEGYDNLVKAAKTMVMLILASTPFDIIWNGFRVNEYFMPKGKMALAASIGRVRLFPNVSSSAFDFAQYAANDDEFNSVIGELYSPLELSNFFNDLSKLDGVANFTLEPVAKSDHSLGEFSIALYGLDSALQVGGDNYDSSIVWLRCILGDEAVENSLVEAKYLIPTEEEILSGCIEA